MPRQTAELDPERIIRELTHRGVDFVLIGGLAAVLHGSPRITRDADVCYSTDRVNLKALGDVLVSLNARLSGVKDAVPFVPDGDTLKNVELLTLDTDAGKLDVLSRPAGFPGYAALRERAKRFDLGDTAFLVASIEDLIAMKSKAKRPKDLADIAELSAILRLRQTER
jgi:predicted nucleotidyltransferase